MQDNRNILDQARKAQAVLDDETFQAALLAQRKTYLSAFEGRDNETDIIAARHGLWALEDLTGQLQSIVNDGKMLTHKLGKTAPQ